MLRSNIEIFLKKKMKKKNELDKNLLEDEYRAKFSRMWEINTGWV